MYTGSDKTAPEAIFEVQCRICSLTNIEKKFSRKALAGHLNGHKAAGWDKARYLKEFPSGESDFWMYTGSKESQQASRNAMLEYNHDKKISRMSSVGVNASLDALVYENRQGLAYDEQEFYDQFFEQIVQQTDRDETQMPQIASLAFDHVLVKRLRNRLLDATKKGAKTELMLVAGEVEKTLKTTEERISKTMDALGISRQAQLKRGAIIKSTPASLISGYLDEIERMSPEMLDALQLEEKRVYARMHARLEKFIFSEAPDIEKEDESDDATGRPLTLEAALSRAGITAGGSTKPVIQPESDDNFPV